MGVGKVPQPTRKGNGEGGWAIRSGADLPKRRQRQLEI